MTSPSNQKNMSRKVCNCPGKCANCYSHGAPCLNCAQDRLYPTSIMTYDEYKKISNTNETYENFCKNNEYDGLIVSSSSPVEQRLNGEDDRYDDYECVGPYNDSYSRCFGPCCN